MKKYVMNENLLFHWSDSAFRIGVGIQITVNILNTDTDSCVDEKLCLIV